MSVHYVGQRVIHKTSGQLATVVRMETYGDIVIMVDGARVPLTTRAVFLSEIS